MANRYVFVDLKRFEIGRDQGGLCLHQDPIAWIRSVMQETAALGLGARGGAKLVYLVPEGLVSEALNARQRAGAIESFEIGCQGVHWDDVQFGGNFGAFTTLLPVKAAAGLGASWTIIGHSEERQAKLQVMGAYDSQLAHNSERNRKALEAVDTLIHHQVQNALRAGLNVLLCVGESAGQRGEGTEGDTGLRLKAVLEEQIGGALADVGPLLEGQELVIGYEPIWAIGPGKVPPDRKYVNLAASLAKQFGREAIGVEPPVVYGGGLKLENAEMLGALKIVDGGLVALTRFTDDIGFDVGELAGIIDVYLQGDDKGRRS